MAKLNIKTEYWVELHENDMKVLKDGNIVCVVDEDISIMIRT